MDNKKQIEEIVRFMDTHIMAKKIAELIPSKIVSYDGRSKGQHLYFEQKMEIAKEMMKQGAVVLTREEYKSLTNELDKGDYGEFESGYAQARKETAREIYKFADDFMRWDEEMFVPSLLEFIKEKYGVEIGEEV